jgi:hypothetical protein
MKRKYVIGALALTVAVVVASPVLAGESLSSLVKKEVAKQLANSGAVSAKKKKSKPGPPGPQGPPGPPGAPGGPVGGGLMSGRVTAMGSVGVNFFAPSGISASTATSTAVLALSADTASVGRALSVQLSSALTGAQTRQFKMLVNGDPNNGLNCTVTSASNTCVSTGTVSIPAGASLELQETPTNSPPVQDAAFGWQDTTG